MTLARPAPLTEPSSIIKPSTANDVEHHPAFNATEGVASRLGWTFVALLVGFTALQGWGASLLVLGANATTLVLIALSLAGIFRCWVGAPLRGWEQLVLLCALMAGVSIVALQSWVIHPGYGTDAAAFDQYSAALLLHGSNPYVHSMAPSLVQFNVPEIFRTYRLDGTAVLNLSYPAGSFLAYAPLLALGIKMQAANIVDLASWFAAGLLLWRMLPSSARWLAGAVTTAGIYSSFVIGGLTDALYVPFVLVAVWRWDRFGDRSLGFVRLLGPIALGLACSVKQTPWFLVPYLVVGIAYEEHLQGRRVWPSIRNYLLAASSTFFLINIPFVVASPSAWVRGTLRPFIEPTIPDGQGLVDTALFQHVGSGHLSLFTAAGVATILLTLFSFAVKYPTLKRAWVPLVSAGFFFPTRSFASYLFMLVPAALVAASSVQSVPEWGWVFRTRKIGSCIITALAVLAAACAAMAVLWPSPLTLHVLRTRSTGQRQTIDQITVSVTNRTNKARIPHFTVDVSGHVTTFWYAMSNGQVDRNMTVGAHQTRIFKLRAPSTASMPGVTTPFIIEAFTGNPAAISTSPRFLVSSLSTHIEPSAFDTPVPVGKTLTLEVQLENRFGSPVRRAGVPVVLGQTVYAQTAITPAESSINGHLEGATPITVTTNENGIATFSIQGVQAQPEPVYYEAWLPGNDGGNAASAVPHGYSNQVSVQYVEKAASS